MTNIGLIVALKSEVPNIFRDTLKVHHLADFSMNVLISGIGPQKAANATDKLITSFRDIKPDYIINLGFCGAISQKLDIGHLVLADRVSYKNSEIRLDHNYIDNAKVILRGTGYFTGKLETFNYPVFSRSKVSKDTLAVDMESYAIAESALKYNVPVLVIKSVSDIIPPKAGLTSLWRTVKMLKNNTKQAKYRLEAFVGRYFQ